MTLLRPLFTILLCVSLTPLLAQATEEAAHSKDIATVLKTWNKNQHLYVKGDVGVSNKDLNNLEKWLDENAKNWTIILMRNARGEQWKDTRGIDYYGMDAVENAMGRGLSNKTEFLDQLSPSTGEKNGAIFILFLDERKFSYFASDAYDSRGLGERNWIGNLDAAAIRAMRHGGGIVDAVTSTTNSIDVKFNDSLRREAEREQRRKTEKASAKAWVERESKNQLVLIDELEKELGKFLAHDEVKYNDLANPTLNDWRETIANASNNSDPFIAQNAVKDIERQIKQHRKNLQLWNEDHTTIEALSQVVTDFKPHSKQSKQEITTVQTAIEQAQQLHTEGKQAYRDSLLHAKQLYLNLEADKVELTRMEAMQARDQEAAEKQQKMTIVAGGSTTGVGLLGLGIYSNRRRRKQKALAEELYKDWKTAMKSRVDQLFKTMDRAGVIVGSERDLPQRGYEGETLKQSINAIRKVDKAFILSSSVHTALETAKVLIYPGNPVGKVSNVFRRSNYDEAIELLERKPLEADPKKEQMKVAERGEETMLGDKTKANKVKMKFTDLIADFDSTLQSADQSLDLVENSWDTIASRCETLGKHLETIEAEETHLEKAAQQDHLYQLRALFEKWLPSAEKLHESGMITGKHDPVLALQEEIKRADTMAAEMNDTISLTKNFRKTELAPIHQHASELKQLNRNNHWIQQSLESINSSLETLSEKGVNDSITEDLATLHETVFALKPKSKHASKLANYTDSKLPEDVASAYESVEKTRNDIASTLSLSADQILNEHREWNPNIILTDAELYRIRSQDMIDQGHITQAQEQADLADAKTAEANQVISDTILAHEHYASTLADVEKLSREAYRLTQKGCSVMSELTQGYHSDALLVDPTDADYGSLTEVEEALLGTERQMNTDISKAKEHHSKGYVLTAAHKIKNAKAAHEHITGLHTLITSRLSELRELEQKNAHTLKSLGNEKEALGKTMEDHRTTTATQKYYQQLVQHFKHVILAVEAPHGESNPFKSSILLSETKDRVKALETQIESDREAFAAAESLYAQLMDLYKEGETLAETARQDGITDSSQTTEAVRLIYDHAERIKKHRSGLKTAHTIWQDFYTEMQLTGQALGKANAALKHELEQAQQALASIQSASKKVSQAMNWSGSYGVRISGSYGSSALHGANNALNSGDYYEASSLASSAINAARSAISSAESEVASIRRARAAEARRQRISRQSSSSSSSFSSFGGSSSSGSSGGSSSSGSSGSGFSRSGW